MEDPKTEVQISRQESFDSWKVDFDTSFQKLTSEPFNKRLQALTDALDSSQLDSLSDWSPKIAREIASYLAQTAPAELEAWTKDRMEFFALEENKRVNQVIATVRRQLNLAKV